MITLVYIILLIGLIILERSLSESGQHKGLILAFIVFVGGFFISPQLFWASVILGGINIGRTCISELWLLRLTAKS